VSNLVERLPLSEVQSPSSLDELKACIETLVAERTPIYPLGGETSLNYGLPANHEGVGISLTSLNKIVDFPARDLTITVEAGVTIAELQKTLAEEGQWLPIDCPDENAATIGGLIATAWCGPRRYGYGRPRDYVIGIKAIDGAGRPFKGGGRVVKNVAGYDFCKLLTGSLGSLAIIHEITLKTQPLPQHSACCCVEMKNLEMAEDCLSKLVHLPAKPAAIELGGGHSVDKQTVNPPRIMIGIDGSLAEVEEVLKAVHELLEPHKPVDIRESETVEATWREATNFTAQNCDLMFQASMRPSGVTQFIAAAQAEFPDCYYQSHAGTGQINVACVTFPEDGLAKSLIGVLTPIARRFDGEIRILNNERGQEMTSQACWGSLGDQLEPMLKVKQAFDPYDLLNRGRFIFPART